MSRGSLTSRFKSYSHVFVVKWKTLEVIMVSPRCCVINCGEKFINRVREEWITVYELVFSKDVSKLEDAYERLRCWKARCSRLPAGIECTHIILEALLFETKFKEDTLNDFSVIKSHYALAITRFLNHAASFEKDKTPASLYKIARRLSIPEWIVNLRHEAAHGPDLPSLEILRAGVFLALTWLHSAYWTKGDPTLIMKPELQGLKMRLQGLLEVYHELYRNKFEGVYFIGSINKAMEDILRLNDDFCSSGDLYDKMPKTFDEFESIIINTFFSIFNTAQKKNNELNVVMDYFLEFSYFVPTKEVAGIFYSIKVPQEDGLAFNVKSMWEKLLCHAIQMSGALPILLKKLVDFNNLDFFRQKWAACWVKEISLAIKKIIMIRKEIIVEGGKMKRIHLQHKANCQVTPVEQIKIQKKLMRHCPEYHLVSNSIDLSANHLPDLTHLIEDIICHPRKTSSIYIKELLDIYMKPLSDSKKKNIVKAMNIYLMNCEPGDSFKNTKRFKGKDVSAQINKKMPVVETNLRSLQNPRSGYTYDWEGVPSGMLPWQEKDNTVTDNGHFSFPKKCFTKHTC